jgi:hypothetical protein
VVRWIDGDGGGRVCFIIYGAVTHGVRRGGVELDGWSELWVRLRAASSGAISRRFRTREDYSMARFGKEGCSGGHWFIWHWIRDGWKRHVGMAMDMGG